MERILQYIWQWRLYGSPDKQLTDGRRLCILDPGRLNTDSGPDFFNAKLLIDGTEWAGNVEIHVNASDWNRHGHSADAAYDNVVLHVVWKDDAVISMRSGEVIPQLLLDVPEDVLNRYSSLMSGMPGVRCGSAIESMPALEITDWLESLGYERMVDKRRVVEKVLAANRGDWASTCFIVLSRGLGFNLNSDPFERVARSFPLSVSARHSDNSMQLEALIMGQAGLLSHASVVPDSYYDGLRDEYMFLMTKYGLTPVNGDVWKLARTRPSNFPHRRLAMMSRWLADGHRLWSALLEAEGDIDIIKRKLSVTFDGYWSCHYRFGTPSPKPLATAIGSDMLDVLIVNAVVPLYFAYGVATGEDSYENHAFSIMERMKPESNSIIRSWSAVGLTAGNAFRAQALLQLRKRYCNENRCLDCRIGHRLMRRRCAVATD